MQTLGDMIERLTDDLMVAASSTLFTADRKKKLIQDAYLWATGLFEWPELQRGRDTNSVIGNEYYDYPEDYRTDTLSEFLYFDGKPHKRKVWNDYLEYKRKYPNSTLKIFADYGRQYFIFPTPTIVAEICVWGQVEAEQITQNEDKTIFSMHSGAGNAAVVRKAFSVAMKRIDANLAQNEELGATKDLALIWDKVKKRQQTEQPLNKPMFNVPNFFPGNQSMNIGNFGNFDGGRE